MTKCAVAWPKATALAFGCAETTIAVTLVHINNIFVFLEATHLCPKAIQKKESQSIQVKGWSFVFK